MSAKRRRGAGRTGGPKPAPESVPEAAGAEAVVPEAAGAFAVRPANAADLAGIIALDQRVTGLAKRDYWHDLFGRYQGREGRFLLVADAGGGSAGEGVGAAGGGGSAGEGGPLIVGFISGEVRAWEFGSPPCGWVFSINVVPGQREHGVGTALMDAICERFRAAGANSVRTMLLRRDTLNLAFFRSQGMIAGEYVQLEKILSAG